MAVAVWVVAGSVFACTCSPAWALKTATERAAARPSFFMLLFIICSWNASGHAFMHIAYQCFIPMQQCYRPPLSGKTVVAAMLYCNNRKNRSRKPDLDGFWRSLRGFVCMRISQNHYCKKIL
ncbi:hypothetical protein Hsero_4018 [Herbaspirillum seropedicae SmR1]|uniref:Uncharacterized protein n=1 Tax=Herbaspirillum seropedicae (strain SmR1) TaxID=757424 RepID=D8ISS3_HERSS|nr:hypothetical protein Hsero_4018 [Herbaspirillum seropedicae SmR1]